MAFPFGKTKFRVVWTVHTEVEAVDAVDAWHISHGALGLPHGMDPIPVDMTGEVNGKDVTATIQRSEAVAIYETPLE